MTSDASFGIRGHAGHMAFGQLGAALLQASTAPRPATRRRRGAAPGRVLPAPPIAARWEDGATVPILIAHESPVVAAGLRFALREAPRVEVLPCPQPAQLRDATAAAGAPCIVFSDYRAALDGARAGTRAALWACVTNRDRRGDIRDALDCGVSAYLLADCPLDAYLACIRSLRDGRRHLCPRASERFHEERQAGELTRREEAVLRLIVGGASNQDIVEALGISLGTVKAHVGNVLEKLGAQSRTQAVAHARARGLVADDA